MGIREQMNKNPAITTGITISIVILALVWIWYQLELPPFGGSSTSSGVMIWYSTDDGKTYEADDANKQPNYKTPDGKDAYECQVFKCDGKTVVGFLRRMKPEFAAKIQDMRAKAANNSLPPPIEMDEGIEVKRPGDKDWVPQRSQLGQRILMYPCPQGTKAPAEPHYPPQ